MTSNPVFRSPDKEPATSRSSTRTAGHGRADIIQIDTALESMRDSGFDLTAAAGEPIDSREAAEELRDTELLVETAALPELEDPEEFYDHQLVGLAARLTSRRSCGCSTTRVTRPSVIVTTAA